MPMPVSTPRAGCAPYEMDPTTGATIEIFCADRVVAQSFSAHPAGWYRQERGLPVLPSGPFIVCLDACRDAVRAYAKPEAPRSALRVRTQCGHGNDAVCSKVPNLLISWWAVEGSNL
jgi:hypothetical protein